jgi:protein-arginine kinase activator protein McsA
MICDKCKEREARVFLTQVFGEKVTKVQLCVECAQEPGLTDGLDAVDLAHFEEPSRKFEKFLASGAHYPREAYEFVCEALHVYKLSQFRSGRSLENN